MNKNILIFENFKTNSAGIWYFVPEGVFKMGKPCKGFGSIKYVEGSVYSGDIYYDGKNFEKLGYGQQDFTLSTLSSCGAVSSDVLYKYVGKFDYRKTDWIYGNGVMYYKGADGKPTHFRKAFFSGLSVIGEYRGEFKEPLLEGYTPEMEFFCDWKNMNAETTIKRVCERYTNAENADVLFIGDSYFELAEAQDYAGGNKFSAFFPESYANAGIGGSTFGDWLGYLPRLKGLPQFKKIVVNLGFNDLHSTGSDEKTVYHYTEFLKLTKKIFPKAQIYIIKTVHAPNFSEHKGLEDAFNEALENSAERFGVKVVDWNGLIAESGESCFHSDGVHPNEHGYGIFREFLKSFLK